MVEKLEGAVKELEMLEEKLFEATEKCKELEVENKQLKLMQKGESSNQVKDTQIQQCNLSSNGKRGGTLIQSIRDKIKGQENEIAKFLKESKPKDDTRFSIPTFT
jgi:superfamily II RNA helicase